jgi:hypothetical protein
VSKTGAAHTASGRSSGSTLPGLSGTVRVKGQLDVAHGGQLGGAVHGRHVLALLDADAVLAGDAAIFGDADRHDFMRGGEDAFHLCGVLRVAENARMQVAVASVEDVPGFEVVARQHLSDLTQRRGQEGARHRHIDQVEGRRQPRERTRRALAPVPDRLPFHLALGDAQVVAAVRGEDVGDLRDLAVEAGRVAVHLHDQRGLRGDGQPDRHIRLDHAHHFLIHHLQRGGHQPCGDDGGDRRARRLVGRNETIIVLTAGGLRISRMSASVTSASVPSLPTISRSGRVRGSRTPARRCG